MDNYQLLEKEFVDHYKIRLYWPMKIIGFARFDVKDDKIVQLTFNTLLYRTILLLITDLGVGYLLYISVITRNYLKVPDGLCLLHFGSFANMLLINLSLLNRQSGLILIGQSFRIDSHLGIEDTKFMRNVEVKTITCLSFMIALTNISGGIFLYRAYDVSMTIHIIGSLYFFWLFFCYDDYCFFLLYATFIAKRARYLNVALAKAGGVNVEYLSDQALLNILFWKKSYDELVSFQCRASFNDYRIAFEMVFEMLRIMETYYRFPVSIYILVPTYTG